MAPAPLTHPLDSHAAAAYCGMPWRTFLNHVKAGEIPHDTRHRLNYFAVRDLDEFKRKQLGRKRGRSYNDPRWESWGGRHGIKQRIKENRLSYEAAGRETGLHPTQIRRRFLQEQAAEQAEASAPKELVPA